MPSLRLSRNHRSEPGILRFVDDLFSALWKEDYQPMSEVVSTSTDDDPFGVDAVSDYTGVEIWPQDDKDTVATAAAIAGLVGSGCAARDIAVLTRTNMASHEVADQLRARGIATRVIGGAERFYTRLEVRDMANALDCLAYPYAKFQMLALLRSPFVGLSLDSVALLAAEPAVIEALPGFDAPVPEDAEKITTFLTWFEPLVAVADRVPAWEVVSELMRRTTYLETIAARPNAEQTLANVRKLFSIACSDPLLDAHSFAEKIRQIQELKHRESDAPSIDEGADAVTLMTIHRAKGLEFDVVVLPDTHKKFGKWGGDILTDARTGTVMTRFKRLDTVCWKQLHRRLDETEKDEQLRVLYVGMTRAKRRLCIVTSPSPGERSAAELLTSRLALHERTWPGLVVRKPL
jgi:ATP-dependent exoDNAse (exonuclease V) beta subunit